MFTLHNLPSVDFQDTCKDGVELLEDLTFYAQYTQTL